MNPWERIFLAAGAGRSRPDVSAVNFSNPNLDRFESFRLATSYNVELEEGDCVYIPAYWWQQIDSVPERSIGVTFVYPAGSDWIKMIFHGLEE